MSFRDRQYRTCMRELAAIRILDDLRRWRDAHNRRVCQAIWQLPARTPDRKETGQ
ncbi:hypothetical protein [Streptomyces nymphaeiformis]|uniref:Uncharacterized protein n=1 Tax=Streptomyces nymphaeiformis TaxID=2663842 RepID=A0A7W7U4L6_9ACTN|nr:hypothetical protein [Streptomyces nymphaeiformis]MBB4984968.1 hypothetical protein [Streptomyces nymphaeiformis]